LRKACWIEVFPFLGNVNILIPTLRGDAAKDGAPEHYTCF
jgi:hypothetical protein